MDAILNLYQHAIPPVETSYRQRLRQRLAASPRSGNRPHTAWLPVALTIALAAALGALLLPLGPRSATPVNAGMLLQGATVAASTIGPYSGTAEMEVRTAGSILPSNAPEEMRVMRVTKTWALGDANHFWIQTTITQPALQSETDTIVGNGRKATWYYDIWNKVMQVPAVEGTALVNGLLTGNPAGPANGGLQGYLELYRRMHEKVRLLPDATVLGRPAYVLQIRPVVSGSSSSCSSTSGGRQVCTSTTTKGYGTARLWLDKQYLIVLRHQVTGLPSNIGTNYLYQVTSLHIGQGPTPEQLAFRPPASARHGGSDNGWSSGSGGPVGPTSRWQPPAPFFSIANPVHGNEQFAQEGSGNEGEPGSSELATVSVIYRRGGENSRSGPYVYLEERVRRNGAPALFSTATHTTAGTCTISSGVFIDGSAWAGTMSGHIGLMAVSNTLAPSGLAAWLGTSTACASA